MSRKQEETALLGRLIDLRNKQSASGELLHVVIPDRELQMLIDAMEKDSITPDFILSDNSDLKSRKKPSFIPPLAGGSRWVLLKEGPYTQELVIASERERQISLDGYIYCRSPSSGPHTFVFLGPAR